MRGFADANALAAARRGQRVPAARRGDTRRATSSRSTSTPGRRAPRTSRRPRTPGRCSTTPGTAAGWTAGWPPTAAPTACTRPTSWATTPARTCRCSSRWPRRSPSATRWHASVLGPTWPNRMMWMTGTVDAEGRGGGPCLDNAAPRGGFRWTTYAERLTRAGVSWRVYQQDDTFGCNVLEQFAAFRRARRGRRWPSTASRARSEFAFESDAMADRLPTVSWVICTSTTSEHPSYRPGDGADFVAEQDRRDRGEPGRLGEDGRDPRLRRERRPLRPRRPADPAARHARRVRHLDVAGRHPGQRPAGGGGFPGARASSSRRGRPVAGCAPSRSTTRRRCGSSSGSPGWPSRTSRAGGGARSAI